MAARLDPRNHVEKHPVLPLRQLRWESQRHNLAALSFQMNPQDLPKKIKAFDDHAFVGIYILAVISTFLLGVAVLIFSYLYGILIIGFSMATGAVLLVGKFVVAELQRQNAISRQLLLAYGHEPEA